MANPKTDAEVHAFESSTATGILFFMLFMYVLASLPFVYVFSFASKSSIMAFTNFFILNIIVCVVDAVIASVPVFMQNKTPENGPSKIFKIIEIIRTIFAVLLPSINCKHAISNILLRDDSTCIEIANAVQGTKLETNEKWLSKNRPGVGTELIIFCAQAIFWFIVLILIEKKIKCSCSCDSYDDEQNTQWNDSVSNND